MCVCVCVCIFVTPYLLQDIAGQTTEYLNDDILNVAVTNEDKSQNTRRWPFILLEEGMVTCRTIKKVTVLCIQIK